MTQSVLGGGRIWLGKAHGESLRTSRRAPAVTEAAAGSPQARTAPPSSSGGEQASLLGRPAAPPAPAPQRIRLEPCATPGCEFHGQPCPECGDGPLCIPCLVEHHCGAPRAGRVFDRG